MGLSKEPAQDPFWFGMPLPWRGIIVRHISVAKVRAIRARRSNPATLAFLTVFSATLASCGGESAPSQPSATTGTVAIRVTVKVNSLDANGATSADFPVSVGGDAIPGASAGVVFVVRAHAPFQVAVSPEKPEGHSEQINGFCGGDAGMATTPGEERVCAITETEQPLTCDPGLWTKTYAPWRFRKYSDCELGSGSVQEVWQSQDGDLAMTVRTNSGATLAAGQTSLMVEVPCQFATTLQLPKASCGNVFQNGVHLAAGMRIRFAGPRVADWNHTPSNPQTENHGSVIRILSRKDPAAQAQSLRALPIRPEGYLGGGRYEPEDDDRNK
jgi:hypothetical protein